MLRDPEMRINTLSCKGTGGIPVLGRKLRKKRDGTKSLGLYVGHLRTFSPFFPQRRQESMKEKPFPGVTK